MRFKLLPVLCLVLECSVIPSGDQISQRSDSHRVDCHPEDGANENTVNYIQ